MPVITRADVVCFLFVYNLLNSVLAPMPVIREADRCVFRLNHLHNSVLAPMPVITDMCVAKEDSWKQVNTISRSQKWDNEENTNGKIVLCH